MTSDVPEGAQELQVPNWGLSAWRGQGALPRDTGCCWIEEVSRLPRDRQERCLHTGQVKRKELACGGSRVRSRVGRSGCERALGQGKARSEGPPGQAEELGFILQPVGNHGGHKAGE